MSYRGIQVAPMAHVEDVQAAVNAGAKLIRCQMTLFDTPPDKESWKAAMRLHLSNIKKLLDKVRGLSVVIDVHSQPAGDAFASTQWAKDALIELWAEIAYNFRSQAGVVAYGILNEPRGMNATFLNALMKRVTQEIRKADKYTPVLVTCDRALPPLFEYMQPAQGLGTVWYEAHMYYPPSFAMQGVPPNPVGPEYPNDHIYKSVLREYLKPVIEFKKKHGVEIYIGEFSASHYADEDSRFNYLRDCIEIFEANKFFWSYHAWREASVWNMEDTPKVFNLLKRKWKL